MTGYILSILGIVLAGMFIDIIIPSGVISKYIKGIYSIFIVAVIISPVVKFLNKSHNFTIKYQQYEIDSDLIDYINTSRASSLEINIEKNLSKEGYSNVDIILSFSTENNELKYKSCQVDLKNLVISADKQHINKYEFIKTFIKETTNLTDEEIMFDE